MPKCEPVGIDFAERAAVVVSSNAELRASPEQVWQVLNEIERWPEWFEGMKTARVTSERWDGLGSTRFVRVGPMTVHEEVVAWEPGRRWAFCATEMGYGAWVAKRLVESIDIEPQGAGSRLTYTGAMDPVPWLRPFGSLLGRKMASAWATSLAAIDRHVEP